MTPINARGRNLQDHLLRNYWAMVGRERGDRMEEESSFAGFRDDEIEEKYLDNHGLSLCTSSR